MPIYGVFVDYRRQGRGIGRQMTAFALEEANRRHRERIRLSAYASNARAMALYRSLGFVETGREHVLRRGQPDEKVMMQADTARKEDCVMGDQAG